MQQRLPREASGWLLVRAQEAQGWIEEGARFHIGDRDHQHAPPPQSAVVGRMVL